MDTDFRKESKRQKTKQFKRNMKEQKEKDKGESITPTITHYITLSFMLQINNSDYHTDRWLKKGSCCLLCVLLQ